MDSSRKKELTAAYRQREVVGGVYAIRCQATNRKMLEPTVDLAGAKNRFAFSAQTGLCPHHLLKADWQEHGAASFYFDELETLAKKEEETMADYKAAVEVLCDMLRKEIPAEELY